MVEIHSTGTAQESLADWCWRQFEGEAKQGSTVKILGVGAPTIGNTGASIGTPETVTDSSVLMPIDEAKYFNFMVDDVDEAQSVDGLMEVLMDEATKALALEQDSDVAAVASVFLHANQLCRCQNDHPCSP